MTWWWREYRSRRGSTFYLPRPAVGAAKPREAIGWLYRLPDYSVDLFPIPACQAGVVACGSARGHARPALEGTGQPRRWQAGPGARPRSTACLPDPGLLTSVTAQTLPSGVSQWAQWVLLLGAEAGLAGLGSRLDERGHSSPSRARHQRGGTQPDPKRTASVSANGTPDSFV